MVALRRLARRNCSAARSGGSARGMYVRTPAGGAKRAGSPSPLTEPAAEIRVVHAGAAGPARRGPTAGDRGSFPPVSYAPAPAVLSETSPRVTVRGGGEVARKGHPEHSIKRSEIH